MNNLKSIENLAKNLMSKHGLNNWSFKFDNAKVRFGYCNYDKKLISLSKNLCEVNNLEEINDTILHEIAHALCEFKDGHGAKWQNKCLEVGAKPTRFTDPIKTKQVKSKNAYCCKNCKSEIYFYRPIKRKKACGVCCCKYSQGRFDEKYELIKKD